MWGSIPEPQDPNLSQNQEWGSQPTAPPRCNDCKSTRNDRGHSRTGESADRCRAMREMRTIVHENTPELRNDETKWVSCGRRNTGLLPLKQKDYEDPSECTKL